MPNLKSNPKRPTIPKGFLSVPHNGWSMLPAAPGVYILDGENGAYVGSSVNIRQRVSHHPMRPALGHHKIYYRLVEESKLGQVETEVIEIVRPFRNKMKTAKRSLNSVRMGLWVTPAFRERIVRLEKKWYPNTKWRVPVSKIIQRAVEFADKNAK